MLGAILFKKINCLLNHTLAAPFRTKAPFKDREPWPLDSEFSFRSPLTIQVQNASPLHTYVIPTSTPQLPFRIPHIPTSRENKALNRGTFGGSRYRNLINGRAPF